MTAAIAAASIGAGISSGTQGASSGMQPFGVALMKGKQWPGNTMGIYRRSPPLEAGKPCLVVKMDVA